MRWVIMAKSEVRMPQPHAVVCEVTKTNKGYKLNFANDNTASDDKGANESIREMENILNGLIEIESADTKMQTAIARLKEGGSSSYE